MKRFIYIFKDLLYLFYSYIGILLITFLYAIYDINNLNYFVNNYLGLISIVINIILIIILIKKEKIIFKKISVIKLIPYFYLSLSFTILFNVITLLFYANNDSQININILLISSGIVGPILEELVFRKLIMDKLLKFYSKRKSILISSLVFAIIHFNIVKFIYAFVVGIIYGNIYTKRKNIIEPIIIHCLSNIVVLIIMEFNIFVFIFSLFSFLFSIYLIYTENN